MYLKVIVACAAISVTGLSARSSLADVSVAHYLPASASQSDGIGPYDGTNYAEAQTFTVEGGGLVQRIGISLQKGPTTEGVFIQLRDVSGNAPGQTILASASLAAADIVGSDFTPAELTYFDFSSSGVNLVDGSQYALVIGTTDTELRYFVNANSVNPYGGGGAFQSVDGGQNFLPYGGQVGSLSDVFDVRVPEPASGALLLVCGVGFCALRRRSDSVGA